MTAPEEWELDASELVRPYVITKGRGLPDEEQLSLITLVSEFVDKLFGRLFWFVLQL